MKTLYNTSEINIKNLKTIIQTLSTREKHLKEGINVLILKMKNNGLNKTDIEDVLDDNILKDSNIEQIFEDESNSKPQTQSNFNLNTSDLAFEEPNLSSNYLISQTLQMDSYNDYNLNRNQIHMIDDENIFDSENEEIGAFEEFNMMKKKMVNSQSNINNNQDIDLELYQHKIEQEITNDIKDQSLRKIDLDSKHFNKF